MLTSLLANEQLQIARVQLQQSQSQFTTIRKQVKAGAMPELNASQAEAQVAMDSANVINASVL
jgi:outer membrane protein